MEVKVRTAELELRTAKLTKSILKQMPTMDYREAVRLGVLKSDGNEQPDAVVGWVHGSVLGDEWKNWLILRVGEGAYARMEASMDAAKKYPQIYVV